MWKSVIGAAAVAALCGGCASAPAPNRTMTGTAATIRAAEELGAGRTPLAAEHLRLARDQAAQARTLYEEGHQERAAYLLLRAEADAELAVALTRRAAAESQAGTRPDTKRPGDL